VDIFELVCIAVKQIEHITECLMVL